MILQVIDIVSMRRKNWVIGATMFGRKIAYRPPANPGACSRMNPVIRVGGSPSAKYERQEDRKKCVEYLVVMNMCTAHFAFQALLHSSLVPTSFGRISVVGGLN
jgi:hypothetical protein